MLKQVYLLITACLLLISCNRKSDFSDSSTAAYPLEITTSSGDMQSGWVNYNTKDSTMSISRLTDVAATLTAISNVKYVLGTAWAPASGAAIPIAASTTNICAYAPYNKNYTDITQLPLTSWMGAGTGSSASHELYYAPASTGTLNAHKNNITLALKRAYVLLRFNLSGMSTFEGVGNVTDFSIYNKNLPESSTINITGNTATCDAVTANPTHRMTYSLLKSSLINQKLSTNPVIEVLLPPCTLYDASNKTLDATITVDGVQCFIRLDLTTKGMNGALASGSCYDFGISLNPTIVAESNCYMLTPGTTILIPVSRAVAGNAAAGYVTAGGTPLFNTGDSFTTGVLWSDQSSPNVTTRAVDQYIKVTAGTAHGNSVVYAKSNGKIVWSWHIWVTNYVPTATVKPGAPTATGGVIPYYANQYWMDRNLGATTSTPNTQSTFGLLYQWGRKDPFPPANNVEQDNSFGQTIYLPQAITNYPSEAVTNLVDPNVRSIKMVAPITQTNASSYAIQYPLMFICNSWAGSTASVAANSTTPAGGIYSWCGSDSKKTLFDPCPLGWRTPISTSYDTSPWNSFGSNDTAFTGASWTETHAGVEVPSPAAAATYYPALGYREYYNGVIYDMGGFAIYWTGSVDAENGSCMDFCRSYLHPFIGYNRAYGSGIRCVQE